MRGDADDQLWMLTPLTPDSFVPRTTRVTPQVSPSSVIN